MLATLGALMLTAAPLAGSASAKIAEVEGTKVGLQERNGTTIYDGRTKRVENTAPVANAPVLSFSNSSGNAVMHSAGIYAIYWDPQDFYHGDWQNVIDSFLTNLGLGGGGLGSLFSVQTQYSDATHQHAAGSVRFLGAYTDTDPYPAQLCANANAFGKLFGVFETAPEPNCITDSQLREQLSEFITEHNLPHGMGTIYDVLTPPGVATCLNTAGGASGYCSEYEEGNAESYEHSFCSYHSWTGTGESDAILYDVIPWSAGGLGDYHLPEANQVTGYQCQDGGFNPEHLLHETKPVEQEPNQLPGEETGPDGTFDHGLADLIINQIGVEEQNTVTDPLLNAWQNSPEGLEATDECRNFFAPEISGSYTAQPGTDAGTLLNQQFGTGSYYINLAFNLAALKLPYPGVPCVPGSDLLPDFTVPAVANSGEIVGFDGMESTITLNWAALNLTTPTESFATYTWNFGDGSAPVTGYAPGAPACNGLWLPTCAASEFHTYAYGGTYTATLTVRDTGGHEATVTHEITVNGPPKPGTGAGAGAGSGSGSSGNGSSNGGSSSSNSVPPPTARAAAASGSLKTAIKQGLMVRYAVNEQVAGVVEVLLDARTAKRLHIRGPVAVGLPSGYPRSLVIGRAVLVTRKAGSGAVRLKFTKATNKALQKVRRVSLGLRVVVRNASRTSPLSTSLLSSFVLKR